MIWGTIFNISCNNLYIMQKNLEKNIYIYIPNHFTVHLKLTQYRKSILLQ